MKKSCIFAAWFKTNENENANENRLKMKKIYAFLNNAVQHSVMGMIGAGYANGYVAVPPEHPLYGYGYDTANETIDIHGGLTFSAPMSDLKKHGDWKTYTECIGFDTLDEIPDDYYVFGFDTMHFGDDELGRDWCINETNDLLSQFEKIANS